MIMRVEFADIIKQNYVNLFFAIVLPFWCCVDSCYRFCSSSLEFVNFSRTTEFFVLWLPIYATVNWFAVCVKISSFSSAALVITG